MHRSFKLSMLNMFIPMFVFISEYGMFHFTFLHHFSVIAQSTWSSDSFSLCLFCSEKRWQRLDYLLSKTKKKERKRSGEREQQGQIKKLTPRGEKTRTVKEEGWRRGKKMWGWRWEGNETDEIRWEKETEACMWLGLLCQVPLAWQTFSAAACLWLMFVYV